MKKIYIIFALAFTHFFNVYGQKEKLDQLFDRYQEVEGVTSIKIAKPMFGMLSNLNIADSELDQIKPLLAKINGLKVLITEDTNGGKSQNNLNQLNKEISSYLKNMNYSEMMSVKNGDSKIKFLSSEAKNGILEDILLRIDSGNGENILVMLDGKLSMDDVNNIINSSETKTSSSKTTNIRSSFNSEDNSSYLNGETRNVGQFSKIDVSMGVNVNFKQDNTTSVNVFADADKLQHVITKVENGTLKVYTLHNGKKNLNFKNLTINVKAPHLEMISTSIGGTFTTVKSLEENSIYIKSESGGSVRGDFSIHETANVDMSSGGNLKANLVAQHLILNNSSGANAILKGSAKTANIDVNSGASCTADDFIIDVAQAKSTSGASLSLYVKNKLKIDVSSGGTVKLKGNPDLDSKIDKVSGGSLNRIK